jgi:tetratricopeptide (TPR) repeat protein
LAVASPLTDSLAVAQGQFREAEARHHSQPADFEAAWKFGRACFDLAEFATNQLERAGVAEQGLAACRQAVARSSNSAPAHYYLAMNLGQIARTKGLGALKLIGQMRQEFDLARALDERLDYAGPDRNLGQLYRDAPALASIGDRARARQHLERAVVLAPDYPDNRLTLVESCLKWGDREGARGQLDALDAAWPRARATLTGPAWASSWADWDQQRNAFRKRLAAPPKVLRSPRSQP